ncbi:MAG: low temperature requirement protein A [Actinomycetota bacterium]|nr:low temperature requirement protein A [Actinomycetota bacterium]
MTGSADERQTAWPELFLDLVFAFGLTEIAALAHQELLNGLGLARTLVVLVPLYWAWVGTSVHVNTHGVETDRDRLGIFAIALCALFMALSIPSAFAGRSVLFAASYLALRAIVVLLVAGGKKMDIRPFLVSVIVTGPLLLMGAFLTPVQLPIWGLAAVTDLSTPLVLRRVLIETHFDPQHLPERFGSFILVALGESIIAIGLPAASARHLEPAVIVAVAVSFVLVSSLWWLYSSFGAPDAARQLAQATAQTDVVRQAFAYGHLFLAAAVISISVGFRAIVTAPDRHLGLGVTAMFLGGIAVYVASIGITTWPHQHRKSSIDLAGAAVVAAVIPAATITSGLIVLEVASLTVILAVAGNHVNDSQAGRSSLAASGTPQGRTTG